jgi:hypothetical protein
MWLFTKEAVIGIVRTGVTYAYALLIEAIPAVEDFFAEVGFSAELAIVAVGTALYMIIRAAAEKFPWIGHLLVFNQKPHYQGE